MSKRNWNRAARRAASLLVALCMLCALIPAAALAYANNGWTESVVATNENQTEQFDSVTSTEQTPGGIYVWAENSHDANVTVNGAIRSEDTAVQIVAGGEDSDVAFKSGDVTQANDNENSNPYGVDVNTYEQAKVNAEVGSVSAENDAVHIYANTKSEAHVTVNGDATSQTAEGVEALAGEGATADVTVTGNAQGARGVDAEALGGTAYVTVGDVTATGSDGSAVNVFANREGTAKVVAEDVTGPASGATVRAVSGGDATLIAQSVDAQKTGVYANAGGEGSHAEVFIGDDSGKGSVTAKGDYSDGLLVVAERGGDVAVTVNGDVKSDDEGLALKVDSTSSADILVTGTISGENCGVGGFVSEGGKATLTVWKIESSTVDNQVKVNDFRAGINYIVKIAESAKGILSAFNASDGALAQSRGYEVTHEDEIVRVKVADLDGYEVVGVYNGEGDDKKELTKDADGRYSWGVGKGGGVLFSAILKAIAPDPKPEPSPEPTKEPEPSPEPSPEPTKDPEPSPSPTPKPTKDPEPSPSPTPKPDDSDDDDDEDEATGKGLQSQELVTIAVVEGEDSARVTFSVNSGFSIRYADGATEKGNFEEVDGVPTLFNGAGEPAVLNADGALSFAEDGEAIALTGVTQRYLRVVFPDGHEEEGDFELLDGTLALVNAGATKFPVGEDGTVTFASMDDPNATCAFTLDPMTLAVVRAALG